MVSQEQLESRFLRRRHRLTTDCIVDAVMIRIRPRKADSIEVRLVQLKAGASGLTAAEIGRLKKAAAGVSTDWLRAAHHDGVLHMVPEIPKRGNALA